jgi:pyrimidine operon attenuation protein / uracil phosphoribosyltransferase
MQILDQKQIFQKIHRIGMEILEQHYDEREIILAGINSKGYQFAQLILSSIQKKHNHIHIQIARIKVNPANPVSNPLYIELPADQLKDKVIIVIDDVSNTGRTIFYAFKTLMDTVPKKVEVAVLVDRKHKRFPVHVDYFGLSLATTLKEHIDVKIEVEKEMTVMMI